MHVPLAPWKHSDAYIIETPWVLSDAAFTANLLWLSPFMCGVDQDIMYVFEMFVGHLDALHPSCAALWGTTLWCLLSDTPVMQCDAQNAGSQVKMMTFNGPPYAGVL